MSSQLIAIAGGSGSGKTWLARQLQEKLADAGLCSLDNFYLDQSHLSPKRRSLINFDHPRTIDWAALQDVLQTCKTGNACNIPTYDFSTHTRRITLEKLALSPFIIFEGLWLLRKPAVRKHFNHRYFINCPEDVRFSRRISRDAAERGRSEESIREQLFGSVRPMHERYVESQKRWATRVLEHPIDDQTVNELALEIKDDLAN
jgi:uridine kinase